VILVDANLLVYAEATSMREHAAARRWLEGKLNGPTAVGLPWPSLLAFVRITSNRRVFANAGSCEAAWERVVEWLARRVVWIPVPTERHAGLLGTLVRQAVRSPELMADAHLAALAIEHGLVPCSTDGDFARFPGLRWEDPLRKA
jgi:toxin-antitoxin system PIN domain toxin